MSEITLTQLIEQNRRIAGYEHNCDCGRAVTVEQTDLFGGSKGYCQACYDELGGDGE
ncbi:hypothetical protein [Exiguobacterium sp. s21]|uniref:hypothetical protein n=1 Tax=Exiguobacterium sp. s21 TaxID=2751244 RepID=UPI001BE93DD1|nr:hypothetical protein [Exiguobacterium sp. s21]